MQQARFTEEQMAFIQRRGLSLRRACARLQVPRSTIGYESNSCSTYSGSGRPASDRSSRNAG